MNDLENVGECSESDDGLHDFRLVQPAPTQFDVAQSPGFKCRHCGDIGHPVKAEKA